MDAISLKSVCKSFGQVQAVRDLNARIPTGSIYGFLGPNGAGKTTTIRMIMNIIRPDSGTIEVLGNNWPQQIKDRVGYMPEERGLYRKMTAAKVLAYFASIKGVPSHKLSETVSTWLRSVELSEWANKRVEELSRGMHQKLQFAVTAVNDPDLLILDEPFAGLDPLNTDLLKAIICQMKEQGKTIIFSTHIMHEAERLCDYILLINKGKVILDGSLTEIRSRFKSDLLSVETEGDRTLPQNIPGAKVIKSEGNNFDIALTEHTDTQQLLRYLMQHVRIRSFEVKTPSLHEIFVELVGKKDAQNTPNRPA